MEEERAGGPLKVFVDIFLVLLILAAFALSVIFFVRNLNAGNAAHSLFSEQLII
jgi:hypothetical protein